MRTQPQSSVWGAVKAFAGFALLLAAHFTVRPLFAGRVNVDFLLIAVLFASVRLRPGVAAILGLCAGLAVDAMAPQTFGAATLAYVAVAYVASWVKAVFFADHVALTGLFVFLGKLALDVTYTVVAGGITGVAMVVQLLLWSPLSAALTALVAILLLTILRPLYRPPTS